jgi:flagellar protein FlaG
MQVQANSQIPTTTATPVGTRNHTENLPGTAKSAEKRVEPQQPVPTQQEVEGATKKLQNFVDSVRSDIQFSMDQDSGRTVVKVIDKQTKDVLMQFPSEEALGLAKALDKFKGLLIKQQA